MRSPRRASSSDGERAVPSLTTVSVRQRGAVSGVSGCEDMLLDICGNGGAGMTNSISRWTL